MPEGVDASVVHVVKMICADGTKLIWQSRKSVRFWRYSVKDFSSKAEESINRLTEDRKDSLEGFRIRTF